MEKKILLSFILLLLSAAKQLPAQSIQRYLDTSETYYNNADFASALRYARYAEPLIIDSFGKQSTKYAWFTGQFYGMNYEDDGNVDSALYWYLYSIRLFEKLGDSTSKDYAEDINNYGNLLNKIGSFSEALPWLKRSATVLNLYPDPDALSSYGASLNNLGNYHNNIGEYLKAELYYQQCLDTIDRHPGMADAKKVATLLHNLALVNEKIGNHTLAQKYYLRSLDSLEVLPRQQLAGINYGITSDYANHCISIGQRKKAEQLFKDMYNNPAFKVHTGEDPKDKWAIYRMKMLLGFGRLEKEEGKLAMAKKYYEEAVAIAKKLAIVPALRYAAVGSLAHVYASQHQVQKADSLYEQTIEEAGQLKDKELYSFTQIYAGYIENLLKMNAAGKATEKIRDFASIVIEGLHKNLAGMAEDEQMKYIASLQHYISLIFSAIPDKKSTGQNDMEIFALNTLLRIKGIVLTTQLQKFQSLRQSSDTRLRELNVEWINLKEILYNQYTGRAQVRLNTDSLEGVVANYERSIAASFGLRLDSMNTALSDSIRFRLEKKEAVVEYVNYTDVKTGIETYGAFVIRPAQAPVFLKLCTDRQLKTYFFEGGSKSSPKPENQLDYGQAVYHLIWKPVETLLQKADTIYYSPAGLLHFIAFDALSPVIGQYLLQKKKMVQLSGIQNLLNPQVAQDDFNAAILWGNMEEVTAAKKREVSAATRIKGRNEKKEFFPDELNWVESRLKQQEKIQITVQKDSNATEEKFKDMASSFRGILHISAHGFYKTRPHYGKINQGLTGQENTLLRCGLLLHGAHFSNGTIVTASGKEDGILTGYEIALLNLSKVNVAVLSACETGLGDLLANSEGVQGLQTAFKLAGARKIVLTLWKVNRELTTVFMAVFYKKLTINHNPELSLRETKIEMAKENPPYAWAGFVLID